MDLIYALISFENAYLQALLDVYFKSIVIMTFVLVIGKAIRHLVSSNVAHLFLLAGFVCIAMIPLTSFIELTAFSDSPTRGAIHIFTVNGEYVETISSANSFIAPFIFQIYLTGSMILFGLLVRSAWQLRQLHRSNREVRDEILIHNFESIRKSLGIGRNVSFQRNTNIHSPLSYGLFKPVVVIPDAFLDWPKSIQREVLIHELSHIKRLDWLTLLFTKALTSLLWLNPLLWIAAKRIHDESEQACDTAILENDSDRIRYAEHLVKIAQENKIQHQHKLLAQPMYEGGELSMRIKNILDGRLSRNITKTTLSSIFLTALLFSASSNTVKLFAADEDPRDRDYFPTYTENPLYPRRAVDEEIEGWILFSFTVRSDGRIDPNTVLVVDAEPSGYFENSAKNALLNFEFEARVEDGLAVDVPGVQYLFRYELPDGGVSPVRPAPSARSR